MPFPPFTKKTAADAPAPTTAPAGAKPNPFKKKGKKGAPAKKTPPAFNKPKGSYNTATNTFM